jgi:hypothetical protein
MFLDRTVKDLGLTDGDGIVVAIHTAPVVETAVKTGSHRHVVSYVRIIWLSRSQLW